MRWRYTGKDVELGKALDEVSTVTLEPCSLTTQLQQDIGRQLQNITGTS